MKDKLRIKIVGSKANTYIYLIFDDSKDKKSKNTKIIS